VNREEPLWSTIHPDLESFPLLVKFSFREAFLIAKQLTKGKKNASDLLHVVMKHSETVHICANKDGTLALWADYLGAPPSGWQVTETHPDRASARQAIAASHQQISVRNTPPLPPLPKALPRSLICPDPKEKPIARLFCFPHAGSGASFYHGLAKAWKQTDWDACIVQYPGRESRLAEAPVSSMDALVADLLSSLNPDILGSNFYFFGHSMGALAAYETAQALRDSNLPTPNGLILSGRIAPDLTGRELVVSSMSDAEFLQEVGQRYNAIPMALLENHELLSLVLPALRADFSLMQDYQYKNRPLMDCPILTINGNRDSWVQKETVIGWQKQTKAAAKHLVFDGDHFYLQNHPTAIRDSILSAFSNLHNPSSQK
jgi:surfactin synthase thioesterase subunit/uncharacterized protein YbdZ (MbtH family)